jgi:hypothetical protein
MPMDVQVDIGVTELEPGLACATQGIRLRLCHRSGNDQLISSG